MSGSGSTAVLGPVSPCPPPLDDPLPLDDQQINLVEKIQTRSSQDKGDWECMYWLHLRSKMYEGIDTAFK